MRTPHKTKIQQRIESEITPKELWGMRAGLNEFLIRIVDQRDAKNTKMMGLLMRNIARVHSADPNELVQYFDRKTTPLLSGIATSAYHFLTGEMGPICIMEYGAYGGLGAVIKASKPGLEFRGFQLWHSQISGNALTGSCNSGVSLIYSINSDYALAHSKNCASALKNSTNSGHALILSENSDEALMWANNSGCALYDSKNSGCAVLASRNCENALRNSQNSDNALRISRNSGSALKGSINSGDALIEASFTRFAAQNVDLSSRKLIRIVRGFE